MEQRRGPITRRTVLRGLGVTMCLPFLESLQPRAVQAAVAKNGGKPPVRFAAMYMPNGVNPHHWTPKGVGSDFELSEILAPLAKVKSDILVLTELMNKNSIQGDGHYVKVAPFLTGSPVMKTTGADIRCGVSLDQLVAQRIGNLTPLPSLELAIEQVTLGVDPNVGFTRLYGSHISWSTPSTPVTREVNPRLAFDRLFRSQAGGDPAKAAADRSVLDAVAEDAKRLQSRIGRADKLKVEEYLEAVRAVEKRIEFDAIRREEQYKADPLALREVENLDLRVDYYLDPGRASERGIDHTEHVRLMLDLIVLGFWTDTTRVATFMFANEVSGKNFSFLEGVSGGHHQISHHENNAAKMEEYKRINIWHLQQVAYMLERMKSIKEGNGTLLDNSMVLFGAGMRDGNAHSPVNLPLILAGRAGNTLATGRHLVYEKRTPLCNLYVGLAERMGVKVDQFGDSTGVLPGLDDPSFKGVVAS